MIEAPVVKITSRGRFQVPAFCWQCVDFTLASGPSECRGTQNIKNALPIVINRMGKDGADE